MSMYHDEHRINDQIEICREGFDVRSMCGLNISELMGNDFDVHVSCNKNGFNVEIECDEDGIIVIEDGIHEYAAESLANFCKQYLFSYENALKIKEKITGEN